MERGLETKRFLNAPAGALRSYWSVKWGSNLISFLSESFFRKSFQDPSQGLRDMFPRHLHTRQKDRERKVQGWEATVLGHWMASVFLFLIWCSLILWQVSTRASVLFLYFHWAPCTEDFAHVFCECYSFWPQYTFLLIACFLEKQVVREVDERKGRNCAIVSAVTVRQEMTVNNEVGFNHKTQIQQPEDIQRRGKETYIPQKS